MKLYFLLFFFISTSCLHLSHSQSSVTYKKFLAITLDDNSDVPKELLNKYKNIKESMSQLTYTLIFNDTESLFKLNKFLENDSRRISKRAITKGKGNGQYYTNIKEKKIIHQQEFGNKMYDVIVKKYDYKLTKQTKMIGEYTCYKAIAKYTLEYLGMENDVNIVAWYTPDLYYSFGPIDISGLPGLVLEASVNKTKYIAVELDIKAFNNEKSIFPENKGEEISSEGFDGLIRNFMKDIRQ